MARRLACRRQMQLTRAPRRHEQLEVREMLSADPLEVPVLTHHGLTTGAVETAPAYDPNADFWIDSDLLFSEPLASEVEQTLADAHEQTGLDQVVANYGFDGSGQTVAVIDSGIAYSHYALGGGVGEGYRVVGGWDFTENDADFYDDGPNGAHGTHVAGIVGAAGGGDYDGVATGVDLVGLRVFDDAGNGYFSWVESALDWVLDNQYAFENPITAINLSLGTQWNSHQNPSWAMLEEEFAALEDAGIFISISAGNDYTTYNTDGVSYPASSDHVIPVMATDDNGQLSYFSQRAEYAIAAPGRTITSTVPDYAANDGDSIDDDWLSMSGTSMAAPYVAGASTLVREAMEFVGMTDIDQWDIYDHMMATGDTIYDSSTDAYYQRLNLEAAIEVLMPVDDFGSDMNEAYHLGSLNDTASMSGVITTLADGDYFTFTAGATGQVTVASSNATHSLVTEWDAWGGDWSLDDTGALVIDVIAGQEYTVAISTAEGLGYYDLDFTIVAGQEAIDWGAAAAQQTQTGLSVSGSQWYSITAGRSGYFTAEAMPTAGNATIAIYDAQQNLLASDGARADALVTQGDQLFLHVSGDSSDLDVRVTNALTVDGTTATLVGTSAADELTFVAGKTSDSIALNGVQYALDAAISTVSIVGGEGSDLATVVGSEADEVFDLAADSFEVSSAERTVIGSSIENITADGGQGSDVVRHLGSAGDDTFIAWSTQAISRGTDYEHLSRGFEETVGVASGGYDQAVLYDSAGDDTVVSSPEQTEMTGSDFRNRAEGFDRVLSYATSGVDTATFYDSEGNDLYRAWDNRALMVGSGYYNYAMGFDQIDAFASAGGADRAEMFGGSGDDVFLAWSTHAVMQSASSYSYARGFEETVGVASGGYDQAVLYDSAGDDTVVSSPEQTEMTGSDFRNRAEGFDRVLSYATSGVDTATFYDSEGNDLYRAWDNRALMVGSGYYNYAMGFDQIDAFASAGGADRAEMFGGSGDDVFLAWSTHAVMQSASSYSYARGFEETVGVASGGYDQAVLYDSAGDDTVVSSPEQTEMTGSDFRNRAEGFDRVLSYATSGVDTATFYDSEGNDLYRAWDNRALMVGSGYYNYVFGFDRVSAVATDGADRAELFGGDGDDAFVGSGSEISAFSSLSERHGSGFDSVAVSLASEGDDTVDVTAVDYAFSTLS